MTRWDRLYVVTNIYGVLDTTDLLWAVTLQKRQYKYVWFLLICGNLWPHAMTDIRYHTASTKPRVPASPIWARRLYSVILHNIVQSAATDSSSTVCNTKRVACSSMLRVQRHTVVVAGSLDLFNTWYKYFLQIWRSFRVVSSSTVHRASIIALWHSTLWYDI